MSDFIFFENKPDGIFLSTKFTKCEILIPNSYFEDGIAIRDNSVIKSVGIVNIRLFYSTSDKKNYKFFQLTLPIEIPFNTNEEPFLKYFKYDGQVQQFMVLTIYGGNCITKDLTYIQSLNNAINFMAKFNGAKFSNTIPYTEVTRIFKDGITKNGVGLGVPDVLVELLISEFCRDSDNDSIPFRFKCNKTGNMDGYNFIGIKKIPQKSSVLAALAFEDMNAAIRSAVFQTKMNIKQRIAPIEKLIHY